MLIDKTKCIGCRTCVVACPFGHAHYDRVVGTSVKCDSCDGDPVCASVCEAEAIACVISEESGLPARREAPLVEAAQRMRE